MHWSLQKIISYCKKYLAIHRNHKDGFKIPPKYFAHVTPCLKCSSPTCLTYLLLFLFQTSFPSKILLCSDYCTIYSA